MSLVVGFGSLFALVFQLSPNGATIAVSGLQYYSDKMQGGQTPTSITIIVAILGVVGVLGGQLINAWRDRQRSKEESLREKVRLQHERDVEDRHRSRELNSQWHERKLELYARLLANIHDIGTICSSLGQYLSIIEEVRGAHAYAVFFEGEKQVTREECLEQLLQMSNNAVAEYERTRNYRPTIFSELELLGSSAVVEQSAGFDLPYLVDEDGELYWRAEKFRNFSRRARSHRLALLESMRRELGLHFDEIAEKANPGGPT